MSNNAISASPDNTPLFPPASTSSMNPANENGDWMELIPEETWKRLARVLDPTVGCHEEDQRRQSKKDRPMNPRKELKKRLLRGW